MRIARLFKAFATQAQHVCGHNLTHRSSFSKAHSRFFLVFIIVYLLAWVFLRWRVSHDPGSYFFTVQGYAPKYSLTRVQQAQSYLENIFKTSHNKPISIQHHDNKKVPQLCIGMPTAKRPKEQYVNIAIASLLDHLSAEEREQIQLNILIALANPEEHPFYDSSASIVNVSRLADNVLTYHNVAGGSQIITEVIRDLERAKRYNDKSFYDYALVLHQCSQSQAPWTLILEDDTLAQEGWYTRTMDSLRELDRRKNRDNNQADDWLYLRLFYTEKFLGWNSEAWPTYMFWSLLTIILTTGIGLYLRRRFSSSFSSLPYTALPSKQSSPVPNPVSLSFIFSVSFLCVPALIILYFAAGRMTVQPLPTGINVMNNFGCCSQALAFPRNVSLKLSDWLEKNITAATANLLSDTLTDNSWTHLPSFAVDSAIEAFANEQNLQRYALVPSAFQHVGAETYKEGRTVAREWFSISGARGIWNFRFEELG